MRRRKALRAGLTTLALGVSGCTSVSGLGRKTPTTSSENQSLAPRMISLQDVQSLPESAGAELTLSLPSETVTSDQTAMIKATLTNTGSAT